jgi:hypothetical protein
MAERYRGAEYMQEHTYRNHCKMGRERRGKWMRGEMDERGNG